jgi:hypothetical protein
VNSDGETSGFVKTILQNLYAGFQVMIYRLSFSIFEARYDAL